MVEWNMKPWKRYRRLIMAGARRKSGPIHAMFNTWGERYLHWSRQRYRRASGGGGEWVPLAASTIAARRAKPRTHKRKRIMHDKILWVTKTLYGSLHRGRPGNVFKRDGNGITVGIGGNARHPEARVSIARLAAWHHEGAGHLPARPILVVPPAEVRALMVQDAKAAFQQLARRVA